jgi:hypothetical protein
LKLLHAELNVFVSPADPDAIKNEYGGDVGVAVGGIGVAVGGIGVGVGTQLEQEP